MMLIDKMIELFAGRDGKTVRICNDLSDVIPELMKEIKIELSRALSLVEDYDYNGIEILFHGLRGASFNCEWNGLGDWFYKLKKSASPKKQ